MIVAYWAWVLVPLQEENHECAYSFAIRRTKTGCVVEVGHQTHDVGIDSERDCCLSKACDWVRIACPDWDTKVAVGRPIRISTGPDSGVVHMPSIPIFDSLPLRSGCTPGMRTVHSVRESRSTPGGFGLILLVPPLISERSR